MLQRLSFLSCRAAGQQRVIRFKSLSVRLEILTKFNLKTVTFRRFEALYVQSWPGQSPHFQFLDISEKIGRSFD